MTAAIAPPPAPVLRPLRASQGELEQIEFLELPFAALDFAEDCLDRCSSPQPNLLTAEPRVSKRQLQEAEQSIPSVLTPPKAPRLAPIPAPDLFEIPVLQLPDAAIDSADFLALQFAHPSQETIIEAAKDDCLAVRRRLKLDRESANRSSVDGSKMWTKRDRDFSYDGVLAMDKFAKDSRTYSTCSTCASPTQVSSPWAQKASEAGDALSMELLLP